MPVLLILFTVFQLVATPVNNWITRTAEIQADMFGLNAARIFNLEVKRKRPKAADVLTARPGIS